MSRLEKLRERIARNPKHVAFKELDRLLRGYGFEARRPRRGSSHHYYSKGRVKISIPKRKHHMLPAYVRLVLKAIDQAEKEESGDG